MLPSRLEWQSKRGCKEISNEEIRECLLGVDAEVVITNDVNTFVGMLELDDDVYSSDSDDGQNPSSVNLVSRPRRDRRGTRLMT